MSMSAADTVSQLLELHRALTSDCIVLGLDEVSTLLYSEPYFPHPNPRKAAKGERRTFFSFYIATMIDLDPSVVICAGTRLKMKDARVIQSASGGGKGEIETNLTLKPVTSLRSVEIDCSSM